MPLPAAWVWLHLGQQRSNEGLCRCCGLALEWTSSASQREPEDSRSHLGFSRGWKVSRTCRHVLGWSCFLNLVRLAVCRSCSSTQHLQECLLPVPRNELCTSCVLLLREGEFLIERLFLSKLFGVRVTWFGKGALGYRSEAAGQHSCLLHRDLVSTQDEGCWQPGLLCIQVSSIGGRIFS